MSRKVKTVATTRDRQYDMKTRIREAACARINYARIVQENSDKTRNKRNLVDDKLYKCKGNYWSKLWNGTTRKRGE